MIESAQGRGCTGTERDHDLLERHGRAVTRGEDTRHRSAPVVVDLDLTARRELDTALEPLGVGQQANLHEDAFEVEPMRGVVGAVGVLQPHHATAVAMHLGGECADDHIDVGKAAQLALEHLVGTQLAVELDEGHVTHDAGEVDRGLDA